jgi:antitoxin PrlF
VGDIEQQKRSATLRAKNQMTLPDAVRGALHVAEGDEVEFVITESGDVLLRGMTKVPADQRWFWDEQWQAGERQATAEIAAGEGETFDDVDAMFDALDR